MKLDKEEQLIIEELEKDNIELRDPTPEEVEKYKNIAKNTENYIRNADLQSTT